LKTQISIIGCGWLGLDLAKNLIANGYTIKGSTTSKDKLDVLKTEPIIPFLIRLNETEITGNSSKFLSNSETIIINMPPGLRKNPNKNHVAEIKHLVKAIEKSSIKNVLYISSTSVFKEDFNFTKITEHQQPNATSNSGKQLIEIENLLIKNSNFNTTILRFGGLLGDDRHPAKHLSGRSNLKNPKAPINLIRKNDCMGIILNLIKNNIWNVSLNAVFPKHSTKKNYYTNYCKAHGLPLPIFNTSENSKGKIIDSYKLVQLLNYTFKKTP
jgi:nucleoside-diphosphate-sugar epimerase